MRDEREPDRPHFIERGKGPQTPEQARRARSSAMIVLGLLLLGAAVTRVSSSGGGTTSLLLLGILGVGLIVGGLVTHP